MSKKQKTADKAGRKNSKTGKYSQRSRKDKFGKFCLITQAVLSILFMGVLVLLDMLPMKYLSLAAMLLFFIWCISFTTQAVRKKKGITGKVFSLLMIFSLAVGSFYIAKTNNMIAAITSGGFKVDKMVVAVLQDDLAETLEDTIGYNYGVQFNTGAEHMQAAVLDVQNQLGDLETTEYNSVQEQAKALINGEVDALIYNQAYTNLMNEAVEGYSSKIKIIYKHDIETKLDFGGSAEDDTLTKKPFTVYISGMDTYGDDRDDGRDSERSDVNIIAVVNPNTNQVLLVTTPRDYYVPIPGISNGMSDKLTHAGLYGIDVSMDTLGALYETDINYYVQLNFSSLIKIVDILGGVDVYSEYAFDTGWESGCEFSVQEGMNHFNGEQALAFCRERHALADGDNQRGKNQQAVITAMLKKVLSPSMLLKANSVINQVSKDVETNITQGQLNSLVKNQLKSGDQWTIQSVAAEGTGGEDYCFSAPDMPLYVQYPDEQSLYNIINLTNVVEEGGMLESGEMLN